MCVYIYIYTHTYIHAHIHTYIHTYTHRVLDHLSSDRILTMEWIDGQKLTSGFALSRADLPLLKLGIACTLSQMLESGFMHADPHAGNLMKTNTDPVCMYVCVYVCVFILCNKHGPGMYVCMYV